MRNENGELEQRQLASASQQSSRSRLMLVNVVARAQPVGYLLRDAIALQQPLITTPAVAVAVAAPSVVVIALVVTEVVGAAVVVVVVVFAAMEMALPASVCLRCCGAKTADRQEYRHKSALAESRPRLAPRGSHQVCQGGVRK